MLLSPDEDPRAVTAMLLLSAGVATPVAQDRDVSSSFTDLTGEMCTTALCGFFGDFDLLKKQRCERL